MMTMLNKDRIALRINEDDQARIERIEKQIAEHNPAWAKQGISVAGVIRHCLMACDPREASDDEE